MNHGDVNDEAEYIKRNNNVGKCKSIVGSLLYPAVKARPDVAFVASFLSSNEKKPELNHLVIAKLTLRYLRGTKNVVLKLRPGVDDQLHAHTYADCGFAERTKRRSRSGIIIWYGPAPKYTATCCQKSVSLSSIEAEYMALSETCRVLKCLRHVLTELGITKQFTLICQDDNGTTEWANGGHVRHFSERKHVDIRHSFISEKVKRNEVRLIKVESVEMLSDFLKKPLGLQSFTNTIEAASLFRE